MDLTFLKKTFMPSCCLAQGSNLFSLSSPDGRGDGYHGIHACYEGYEERKKGTRGASTVLTHKSYLPLPGDDDTSLRTCRPLRIVGRSTTTNKRYGTTIVVSNNTSHTDYTQNIYRYPAKVRVNHQGIVYNTEHSIQHTAHSTQVCCTITVNDKSTSSSIIFSASIRYGDTIG